MAPDCPKDWFVDAFDVLYPVVYAHRTVEAAAPEAAFAAACVRLGSTDRLLDLCCGNGRHLAHLREFTPHTVGLDYSAHLLRLARDTCGSAGGLVRADMRAIPFGRVFDVVTNFFTSFGYFECDTENAAVLAGIARTLKPGGRFFIDYVNEAHLRQRLVPHSERRHDAWVIFEDRWLDEAARRVNKRTTVHHADGPVRTWAESVRLYSHGEMEAMLGAVGLEITDVFGDYTGVPFANAYPRMILAGRRP